MRLSVLVALAALVPPPAAAEPFGEPVWEIREGLAQPESAYFDKSSKFLFISNVAGDSGARDGKGWIMKADLEGKVHGAQWVSGLNAPKGLRAHKDVLYVADIDDIVAVSIKTGVVLRRISAPGARMLNDVATDSQGNVYVSDTLGSRIYHMTPKGKVTVFAEGPELGSPNGLAVHQNELHVASWGYTQDWTTKTAGKLYVLDLKSKAISRATNPLGNLDGLELGPRGEWLVSDWVAGKVMRVTSQGAEVLGRGFQGSADFGWVPDRKLLILPRMKENIVSAYIVR